MVSLLSLHNIWGVKSSSHEGISFTVQKNYIEIEEKILYLIILYQLVNE